jgi:hypothetical protein
LPAFLIPQPAGTASVAVSVPGSAGLIGLPIYCQALLLHWPSDARFSNVLADMIQL